MGTTCLATCGPIYVPYLMQYDKELPRTILRVLEISLGRFLMYAIFGLVAGAFGSKVPIDHRSIFTSIAYILLSIFLIASAISTFRIERTCTIFRWSKIVNRPLLLGFITGINICPPFLMALVRVVSIGGAIRGILFFVSFFVGTSLYIIPLSVVGAITTKKLFRNIGRVAAVVVGLWFLIAGIKILITLW